MCGTTTAKEKSGYRFFSLLPDGTIREGVPAIKQGDHFKIRAKGRKVAQPAIKTKNITADQFVRTQGCFYVTQGSIFEYNSENGLEIGNAPSYFIDKVALYLPIELGKKCSINDNTGRLPVYAKSLVVLKKNSSLTVKVRGAFYTVSYSGKEIVSTKIEH